MKRGRVAKNVIIVGHVITMGRDENERASEVVIATDRANYQVEPNRFGRELMTLEGEEVEVRARLVIDDCGNKRISVRAYDFI